MTYQSVVEIVDGIDRLSNRKGKKSALFVTDFLTEPGTVLMNSIKESVNFIYGYCEIADVKTVRSLLDETSNNLDFIFLHSNIYNNIDEHPENTLIFDDRKCWSDSVASLLQILHSRNHVESALLAGDSWLLYRVIDICTGYGLDIDVFDHEISPATRDYVKAVQHTGYGGDISLLSAENLQRTQYQLLISTAVKTELFNQQYTGDFDYRLIAIDAGIGGFSKGFVKHLYGNQSEVYRIDNRSALSAMMLSAIESMDLVDNVKGEFNYEGIRVVAGGEMGYHGDVIVDSITNPNCVIGIADGAGKTLYPPYDAELTRKIKAIEKVIGA